MRRRWWPPRYPRHGRQQQTTTTQPKRLDNRCSECDGHLVRFRDGSTQCMRCGLSF